MQSLFDIINKPLGAVLEFFAGIFGGNFAAAVFVFTLLINIVMIPLSIKSQKSSVQQARIKPKLDELKKRYGDDKQKYNEAMQKLYQTEGVTMSGGCLPMILRLLIMFSIYALITKPLTYLMHIDAETIKEATKMITESGAASELDIIGAVSRGDIKSPEILKALGSINFNFFGIDLTEKPTFAFDIINKFRPSWIMPILAFVSQMLTSWISQRIQKKQNPDAPSMGFMMIGMSIFSLVIGFSLPGGVTFYWTCSSLIGGAIQAFTQIFYGPQKMLGKERVKELSKQCDFEEIQLKKLSENKE